MWLPAFIYSEESNDHTGMDQTLHFKAQTRLWGYALQHSTGNDSFTQIQVDSPQTVRDQTESAQDASPVQSERLVGT